MISTPTIQFKGTGWYVTDYAKKSNGVGKDGAAKDKPDESKHSTSEKTTSPKAEPNPKLSKT